MSDMPYPHEILWPEEDAPKSARASVPVVLEYVQPSSVVDVGCGLGAWLAEFKAASGVDFLGIDGDHVDRSKLLIEPERFVARDVGQPLAIDRQFDLAISLETADRLPEPSADGFVASLTALAPVVLFSAAIPHQSGGRPNEQWPEYWREKFANHDYVAVDCLRMRFWRHKDVAPRYAQNLLFFVRRARLSDYPRLASWVEQEGENRPLSLVHPDEYLSLHKRLTEQVQQAQRQVMRVMLNLRDINVVTFPDWTLPQEALVEQLRRLLRAVVTHPASASIALLITFPDETAGRLLTQISQDFLRPGGVQIAGAPTITGLGLRFSLDQWERLLPCLQGRVVLPSEDAGRMHAVGAESLPTLSVDTIQNREPLITA